MDRKQEIIDTLLYARLALCATHNVKVTDQPDLPMTDSTSWTTNHSKETEAIDHALTALGIDPRAPVEVKKPRWVVHASDCALHNGPAMEPGPCDCDAAIEQEIQAKGKTAPRVTPQDIENNIVSTEIVKHVAPSGKILRWAVLTTRNGFAVAGRPSASVCPENDDASIGEKIAIDNAKSELWQLMGYALQEALGE